MGIQTADIRKVLPDLNKLEDKVFIDIVVGEAPLDSFDKFVNDWKKGGGDIVTRDVNAWWQENKPK